MLSLVAHDGLCTRRLRLFASMLVRLSLFHTRTLLKTGIATALGISGNFMYLAFYHSSVEYDDHFKLLAFQIYTAWAWCMLGVNTILTGLMIWRIVYVFVRHQQRCHGVIKLLS